MLDTLMHSFLLSLLSPPSTRTHVPAANICADSPLRMECCHLGAHGLQATGLDEQNERLRAEALNLQAHRQEDANQALKDVLKLLQTRREDLQKAQGDLLDVRARRNKAEEQLQAANDALAGLRKNVTDLHGEKNKLAERHQRVIKRNEAERDAVVSFELPAPANLLRARALCCTNDAPLSAHVPCRTIVICRRLLGPSQWCNRPNSKGTGSGVLRQPSSLTLLRSAGCSRYRYWVAAGRRRDEEAGRRLV